MKQVPNHINQKILADIKARLNPDIKILFLKFFVVHLFTALLTLSICPQFGFAIFRTRLDLMDLFMKVSPHFCDFACGAFFTTVSMSSAFLVLSRDELQLLTHKKIPAIAMVILSSIGFLIMLNPQLFLQFTTLWLIGCIIGAWLSLDLGTRVLKFS